MKKNNKSYPPSWADRLLEWFCKHRIIEDVQGDLHELYYERVRSEGLTKARWHFLLDVVRSFRRFAIKKPKKLISNIMTQHYLTIAWRAFRKHPHYSALNLLGLSIGLASSILIFSYLKHELSYDDFHQKKDRIVRVTQKYVSADIVSHNATSGNIVGPALKDNFQEVSNYCRLYQPYLNDIIIKKEGQLFRESNFIYADPSFFELFDFKIVSGNLKESLTVPKSLVITEKAAKKYFKDQDPIDKLLTINNVDFKVTALIEDVPENSHIYFELVGAFSGLSNAKPENLIWSSPNYYTYLLLQSNTNLEAFQVKVDDFVVKDTKLKYENSGAFLELILQPLGEVYFASSLLGSDGFIKSNDKNLIITFSAISLLILVIACINYINLTTSRAIERSREVGLRKVVGARKSQIWIQFMGEAFIITLFATFIAVFLVELLLPYFQELAGKQIILNYFDDFQLLLGILGMVFFVSLFSGFYPALILTRFKPSAILNSKGKSNLAGSALRKGLVIFQFMVSIVLIMSTIVIDGQMEYSKNKNLGYDKEQVLILKSDRTVNDKFQAFKNELLALSSIQGVTSVEKLPTDLPIGNGIFLNKDSEEMLVVGAFYTDSDFFSTIGIEILSGRNFEEIQSQENMTLIVNETFLKKFNLDEKETLGKKIIFWGREMEIIGIMNDFHTSSFHKPIEPVMAYNFPEPLGSHILIKVSGNIRESISEIEGKWEENFNHRPYEYSFLDSKYNSLYSREEKAGQLIQIFTFLALFIAGLGLFGLSSYTAVQRSKEMSIRKVLGATVFSVIKILSRDYVRLILVAILISAPLGYYIMQNWLQNFVYRIDISFGSILLASLMVLILTTLTVSYHAYQSAVVNPVQNLRNE